MKTLLSSICIVICPRSRRALLALGCAGVIAAAAAPAHAAERLCDTAFQDCRTPLITLIRNERSRIDVAFWFMEDARYTAELKRKVAEGVPVRVLVDPRANSTYPLNADRLNELAAAGIPMRKRIAGGILHWKMMIFAGQNTVEFSGANYSGSAFVPVTPYDNYVDEAVYFSDDASIVQSFMTKFDDSWVDTTAFANYANINTPLVREYPTFPKDPELNFPPAESYRNRAVKRYDAETQAIDVIMYRITDAAHADAMIRAVKRGVPVRLITEPQQYRDRTRYWHAYNVDRMYAAGVRIRERAHQGLMHQKSVVLRGQRTVIFGSSNWTSPSSSSQQEHNDFTAKTWFYDWFVDQFARKWGNTTGHAESRAFTPLPPGTPTYSAPANGSTIQASSSVTLAWNGGLWSHIYDVYFGTSSSPPLVASNLALGPSASTTDLKKYAVSGLAPGTRYYWRIVSKTMAHMTKNGPTYSFVTPSETPVAGGADIVLYAATPTRIAGNWRKVSDSSAAGGSRIYNSNAGLAKVSPARASPADYFELTFTASAGKPYHLWLRLRADGNYWANDSVHVQFSDAVTSSGSAVDRIGTTGSAEVNLEDCGGCGVSGWGWQDNGYGRNIAGPHLYFHSTGTHTIRVQRREDGVSIDQIVLSPGKYLTASPGSLKSDSTILPRAGG